MSAHDADKVNTEQMQWNKGGRGGVCVSMMNMPDTSEIQQIAAKNNYTLQHQHTVRFFFSLSLGF